jgi:hypothetical protein
MSRIRIWSVTIIVIESGLEVQAALLREMVVADEEVEIIEISDVIAVIATVVVIVESEVRREIEIVEKEDGVEIVIAEIAIEEEMILEIEIEVNLAPRVRRSEIIAITRIVGEKIVEIAARFVITKTVETREIVVIEVEMEVKAKTEIGMILKMMIKNRRHRCRFLLRTSTGRLSNSKRIRRFLKRVLVKRTLVHQLVTTINLLQELEAKRLSKKMARKLLSLPLKVALNIGIKFVKL